MKPLTVLAWDTATERGAAALIDWLGPGSWKVRGEYVWDSALHSGFLAPRAADLLKSGGLEAADLGLIVAGRGPGGFTGLRVGLSLAKGLALGAGRPVLGLGTLEVLASQLLALEEDPEVLAAPVADARHGEVFVGLYSRPGSRQPGPVEPYGRPEEVLSPRPVKPEALAEFLAAAARGRTTLADGPARDLVRPGLAGRPEFKIAEGPPPSVSAVALAVMGAGLFRLAAGAGELNPPLPLYIRQPDLRPPAPRSAAAK